MKVNFKEYFKNNWMVCTDSAVTKFGGNNYGIWSFHSRHCRFNTCPGHGLHDGTLIHIPVRV